MGEIEINIMEKINITDERQAMLIVLFKTLDYKLEEEKTSPLLSMSGIYKISSK